MSSDLADLFGGLATVFDARQQQLSFTTVVAEKSGSGSDLPISRRKKSRLVHQRRHCQATPEGRSPTSSRRLPGK